MYPESESETLFYTNPLHGAVAARILKDRILPSMCNQTTNVGIVGIGYNGPFVHESFEPYIVAAALEHVPYTLTLIDRDPKPLEDITTRRHIYLPQSMYEDSFLFRAYRDGWNAYLQSTHQKPRITYSHHEDLIIRKDAPATPEQLLTEGFQIASIPQKLADKLENTKGLTLIHDDIATLNPKRVQYLDFLSCSNVLYYLTPEKQQKSLSTMTQIAETILLSDIDTRKGVFPTSHRFGGWLNETTAMHTYNRKMEIVDEDRHYQSILLSPIPRNASLLPNRLF